MVHVGFDRENIYIRLDFHNKMGIELLSAPRFVLDIRTPEPLQVPLTRDASGAMGGQTDGYFYRMNEVLEIGLPHHQIGFPGIIWALQELAW